jgi:hypothetical protein
MTLHVYSMVSVAYHYCHKLVEFTSCLTYRFVLDNLVTT